MKTKRHKYQGRLQTLTAISDACGIPVDVLKARMRRGRSLQQAAHDPYDPAPPPTEWDVSVERYIDDNPDGMTLDQIANVFGVTAQAVSLVMISAVSKLRRLPISVADDWRDHIRDALNRDASHWDRAFDDATAGGMSQAHALWMKSLPLSAAAAEPCEHTQRIDAAIGRLEVTADRALLASLLSSGTVDHGTG